MSGFINDTTPSKLGGGLPGSVPLGNLGRRPNINVGSLLVEELVLLALLVWLGGGARGVTRFILRQLLEILDVIGDL